MRKHRIAVATLAVLAALVPVAPAAAQDEMPEMTPEQMAEMEAYMKAGAPGPQHAGLAESVGSYDLSVKSWMAPEAPPMESTGTATRTMTLDGRVLIEEMEGSMMDMPFTGRGMSGFDNVSGKYWSTWNDSMSTGIMVAEGTCDDAGNNCTYTGSFNDPVRGELTLRMTSKWTSPTSQLFEMYGPGPDGNEMKMMEIVYSKK